MTKKPSLLDLALICAASLTSGAHAQAQSPPRQIDPAISQLAARIALPLQEAHITQVIVADLKGPDRQSHRVGKWLADQVSDSLNKNFPGLEVIGRPSNQAIANGVDAADSANEEQQTAREWAHDLGANIVVTGSFAKVPQGIGVSLSAMYSSGSRQFLSQANGLVLISDEITALSPEPIPSMKGGIARAGVAGAGVPTCIYCPPPSYTKQARKAKYQGAVVLQATVATDGRATNIAIVRTPGMGLDTQAVNAVRKWRFKPAPGPDGSPVATIVPIEVTFRLY